jgi:hypothetical protein
MLHFFFRCVSFVSRILLLVKNALFFLRDAVAMVQMASRWRRQHPPDPFCLYSVNPHCLVLSCCAQHPPIP